MFDGVTFMAKWIIVVDDDTANLKMAGHILSKNNMRVTALKSGSSFLEYVNENGMPDLVLLDIKMPVMDGFETLEKLRQIEQQKGVMKTPVIFLTADEDVDTETRGFEVGVSDFIRKPFNPEVLLRRIDNIMSNSQEMHDLKSEATIDKLTGFLNKAASFRSFFVSVGKSKNTNIHITLYLLNRDKSVSIIIFYMVGYIICFISPLKHLYNDAVVIPVAIIKGLRFPFTVTSSTGICNNLALIFFVSSV